MMDKELKREIMLDHYNHPNNKQTVEDDSYRSVHNASESCIDDITVYMKASEDHIEDVKFDGVGCTICTASTDIMCDLVTGKSFEEAKAIIQEYYNMVDDKPFDEDALEEANAFDTLYQQANRIKCGTIGIHAIEELINEFEQ
ncbi:MAG: SUF system NifU family Fe-S cluster assembly protein [Erysipelotrichaceae bacterium]|jgi:nitrogen fixation NifU-like protein|nr:SUF system NifU family Fe-S cluster assembly protein [Erysipelotrichaceae bacterium]